MSVRKKVAGFLNVIRNVIRSTDRFIDWTGKVLTWLVLVLILVMVYEVVARYVFNAPTLWGYDTSFMLGGSLMLLGGAHLILRDEHVRVECIYERLKPRQQLVLDIILWLLFFFPMAVIMTKFSFHYAYRAWSFGETSQTGTWFPPTYPFKGALFVAWCLVTIEGISWFIRDVVRLKTGREI